MAIIVKNHRVRTGGQVYPAGSVIHGLSEAEEKRLVKAGVAEFPINVATDTRQPAETVVGPMTIEQFTELKAAEQKAHLEKLGIAAGSNEKERIEQYAEWLESSVSGNDGDNGPATGMPGV
jgi:uncharacterized protein YunC (DUF1805 family)